MITEKNLKSGTKLKFDRIFIVFFSLFIKILTNMTEKKKKKIFLKLIFIFIFLINIKFFKKKLF